MSERCPACPTTGARCLVCALSDNEPRRQNSTEEISYGQSVKGCRRIGKKPAADQITHIRK